MLTLDYLNTLAEALAPSLLLSRVPQSLEDAVNIISEAGARLRMPLVIRDTDLVFQLCSHLALEMTRRKSFGSLLVLLGVLASWLTVSILPMLPSVTLTMIPSIVLYLNTLGSSRL
jgi:hypothetical protein